MVKNPTIDRVRKGHASLPDTSARAMRNWYADRSAKSNGAGHRAPSPLRSQNDQEGSTRQKMQQMHQAQRMLDDNTPKEGSTTSSECNVPSDVSKLGPMDDSYDSDEDDEEMIFDAEVLAIGNLIPATQRWYNDPLDLCMAKIEIQAHAHKIVRAYNPLIGYHRQREDISRNLRRTQQHDEKSLQIMESCKRDMKQMEKRIQASLQDKINQIEAQGSGQNEADEEEERVARLTGALVAQSTYINNINSDCQEACHELLAQGSEIKRLREQLEAASIEKTLLLEQLKASYSQIQTLQNPAANPSYPAIDLEW